VPVSLASMLQELGSVVSRNLPTFYKRAFRLLGNAPDAEDAVQDGRESKVIGLCRLAVLRLGTRLRPFVSFRGKFLCHGLLRLLRIHSVAFGGIHENVVAAGGGSLIRRIQQADFQKQFAEVGLVTGAHFLDQKLLCGRGVLLCLYLMPLRQSRDLAVGRWPIR
jgi:hypothetical protein